MSTKLLAALAIALVVFGGWRLFKYRETFDDKQPEDKIVVATKTVVPEQLPGMPPELQPSLNAAMQQGAFAMKNWLRTYSRSLQDPRLAWIELDYCGLLYRNDPREAKRIFAAVKERTPHTSPVWPRVASMQRTYE